MKGISIIFCGALASTSSAFNVQNVKATVPSQNALSGVFGTVAAAGIFASSLLVNPQSASAVSGGGLDYAGIDIMNQDFSNSKQYKGKDFTQVLAKAANFSGSNLQGCRFYKAYLINTNFEGADLRGAALEDTSMDGANLKNAIVSGAYFGSI